MLPSNAFYECITGSILIKHLQGVEMAKKVHTVRITTQFDITVSEEYLERLRKYDIKWELLDKCFRNNGMNVNHATMEVLSDETV
jgi:hypothetical protein